MPAVRERFAARDLGVERPDIEILDSGAAVQVVQRATLAQRPTEEPALEPACTVRAAGEQIAFVVAGDRSEPR
ncbi:MAG TPA: hypothetical protein VHJ18_24150 [Streptosporangiaceae bacterium]|nr:hypothetical protein [Streptosporangiaceae bacterium]